jgi:hypothetical protein
MGYLNMNDFILRQCSQIHLKVTDFRQGALSLNSLIQSLEGLTRAIGDEFWSDKVFPLVLDLERINSELIDKKRKPTIEELRYVERCLSEIEKLVDGEQQRFG